MEQGGSNNPMIPFNVESPNEEAREASGKEMPPVPLAPKRKSMIKRSEVWHHFTTFVAEDGTRKGGSQNIMTAWKFDQNVAREALKYMVVLDELPFKFVENQGFRHFMSKVRPKSVFPSRFTVSRDSFQLYINERNKLKQLLGNSTHRVCLTTDTWTSLQRINYMCLTVHFIDNDWKLNKRIINFCPIDSHKGEAIGMAVERCLIEWGIDSVLMMTVDNASSNDTAIAYLKKRFSTRKNSVIRCEHFHVRSAVRFVRQSPARLKRFNETIVMEMIDCKKSLCLDVSTRWNSTYLMLDVVQNFEKAFERFEVLDPSFKSEMEGDMGVPTCNDWGVARRLTLFLKQFYELTLRVSGSYYVTSNTYFSEISTVASNLDQMVNNNDLELSLMASNMKRKFDKYWGNIEKANIVCGICFSKNFIMGGCFTMCHKVRDTLFAMFNEYKCMLSPETSRSFERGKSSSNLDKDSEPFETMESKFKKFKSATGGWDTRLELDKYLGEGAKADCENFDILGWWTINGARFPTLAIMARDVLAIPISTVSSESAFSTGGKVLDAFRSSLTPKIVQALICGHDWIRALVTRHEIKIEEDLEVLERLENGYFSLLFFFLVELTIKLC
ncbi:hypothetical protein K2173_006854 [Erythroxylum novogranatense]|uniref:Transposase n=1 Tax=Erythroxylum novogranatense TaxID=1862640 RepID=A0AAV8SYX4_9ROSI|nr:hypothetical protein K2173_006854 [Erythroxylum novogranatense]